MLADKIRVVRRLINSKKEIHIFNVTDDVDKQNWRIRFEVSVWEIPADSKAEHLDEVIEPVHCFSQELDEVLDRLQIEHLVPDELIYWI